EHADATLVVADELGAVHRVHPLAAPFVGRRHAVHQRVGGPRRVRRPLVGRAGHDLELVHRRGTLAVGGAEAVGAGVAAADDDDVLALGGDGGGVEVALLHPVGDGQVLHRLVDALEVASGDG